MPLHTRASAALLACRPHEIARQVFPALCASLLLVTAGVHAADLAPPKLETLPTKPVAAVAPTAKTAGPAPRSTAPLTTTSPIDGEPRVERTVVEDSGSRIEEMRVRGQTRSIRVQPKGGAASYEIVPADPARDSANGPSNGKGSAGQRVWSVLSF